MAETDLRIQHLVETTGNIRDWIANIRDVLQTGAPNRVIVEKNGTSITEKHVVTSLNYMWAWADGVRKALAAVEGAEHVRFAIDPPLPCPMGGTRGKITKCPEPGPVYGPQCERKFWDLQPPDIGSTT
jgi:hypothetical protein